MKLIYLLLLSMVLTSTVQAADTVRTARPNEPYNAVKLGATTVSVLIPMVQLGYEYRWKKYSWQTTVGSVIPKVYNIDDSIKGTATGFSLRLDGRLHKHNPAYSGVFLGAGLFYTWFKHPHTGLFADSQTTQFDPRAEEDTYLLKKSTIGLVLQLGGHHYIGKHFDIETLIGIGPKVMFTTQAGRSNPDNVYATIEPNIHETESKLGTLWSTAIQLQLSVGYILGK